MTEKIDQSAPNIPDIPTLFDIYRSRPGNELLSMDEFYTFLCRNNAERTLFLKKHCQVSPVLTNRTLVLTYTPIQ